MACINPIKRRGEAKQARLAMAALTAAGVTSFPVITVTGILLAELRGVGATCSRPRVAQASLDSSYRCLDITCPGLPLPYDLHKPKALRFLSP